MAFPGMLRHTLKTRLTATMLAISLLGLWSLSYFAIQTLQRDMERMLGQQQLSAVSVVAASLDAAIDEQLGTLRLMARTIERGQLGEPAALERFLRRIDERSMFSGGVLVRDAAGRLIAGAAGGQLIAGTALQAAAGAGPAQRHNTVGPVITGPDHSGLLPMTVALVDQEGRRFGSLTGFTDLRRSNFLSRIIAAGYGSSGGYMVVEPGQRLIVAATDLRHALGALPRPGHSALVERFVAGYQGSGVTSNSSGVEVLASARRSSRANWYVAAALPTAEAFAPVLAMQRRLLLATMGFAVLLSALTWWNLRHQLSPLLVAISTLTRMRASTAPLQPLGIQRNDEIGQLITAFNGLLQAINRREAALYQSERKLSDILEHADSYIYLKDRDGRYLYANRPVRELFDVSMEQMIGSDDTSYFDPATAAALHQRELPVWQHGSTLRLEEHTVGRRDGRHAVYQSVKLPLRDQQGAIYALCGISIDITARRQAEEALRIAAISFEAQEGIAVLDAGLRILRVNHAFADITGFSQDQACGRLIEILRSERQDEAYYQAMWAGTRANGSWRDDIWLRRRNGEHFYARGITSAVYDHTGRVSHYVCHLIDVSESKQREELRLQQEAAHRDVLVREVHHRIKNNLQGITGILRQFAYKHPELNEAICHAISQVKGMSVVHGLRGRAEDAAVRLCELCSVIAQEIAGLWQTPITVDTPPGWQPRGVAEDEAVPVALVLNELILNAVKHGGRAHHHVAITVRAGALPGQVAVTISNTGQLAAGWQDQARPYSGLQLVAALMPRAGARLDTVQQGAQVVTTLLLGAPAIIFAPKG